MDGIEVCYGAAFLNLQSETLKEADCGLNMIDLWIVAELASFWQTYAMGPAPRSLVYPK